MNVISNLDAHREQEASPFAECDVCQTCGFEQSAGAPSVVFEQDVWDFTRVIGLPAYLQRSSLILNFASISNPRWRTVAKEFLLALMAPDHERVRTLAQANRTPRTLTTCALKFDALVRWLNWLTEQGVTALHEVTDQLCSAFVMERAQRRNKDGKVVGRQESVAAAAAQTIADVVRYNELFTTDQFPAGLRPFNGQPGTLVAGKKRPANGENSTPVVPPEILQPLLAACLYMVQNLGPHVIEIVGQVAEARRERDALARPVYVRGGKGASTEDGESGDAQCPMDGPARDVLLAAIEHRISEGRPLDRLPSHQIARRRNNGTLAATDPLLPVNFSAVARDAGIGSFPLPWVSLLREDLERAVVTVGVEAPFGRDAVHVPRADGQGTVPWTAPIGELDVGPLVARMRSACLLLTAAVSGMRASELAELLVGCRRPPQESYRGLRRFRIGGKLIKGQGLGGTDDEWVVTEEVYEAIALAEHLHDSSSSHLFTVSGFASAYKHFRSWVNGPAGQRLGLAPIPDGPVNLRMLRRSLAVELAYRPGGLLAAKIQLKHVSVVTTEGYANRPGGSQSRFLAEVGKEEEKRNLAIVTEEWENARAGIKPSGPGARDLLEFFRSVDGKLDDALQTAPNVITNDQQVRGMLAKRAKTLHLGAANYCWFADPAKALCLKLAGTPTADRPLIGMCDSARCPQATHHPRHRPVWEKTVEQNKVFIGMLGRGQKTERKCLEAELTRAEKVLADIDAASEDPTDVAGTED